ncbi:MAG: hypothetical protein QNJ38_00405 [Prochloraceae cyanobacterium]|nr:hypothetical protein [Prochloraceae cyanobacterium]
MDILTISILLAAIAVYEELLNGKYKLSAKLLDWLEKKVLK